jgi:dipeptidyl aminopeptidase/acylaminoacyl peptidase
MKTITPSVLFDLVDLSDVRISPNGKHVVFVRSSVDRTADAYTRNVWGLDLASHDEPAPWTNSGKDGMPRWSSDGSRLAFLSSRGEKSAIYVLPMRGEAQLAATHSVGVDGFAWSPDGARLAFTAPVHADERRAEDAAEPVVAHEPRSAFDLRQEKERREHDEKRRFDPRTITRVPYRTGVSYTDDRFRQIYVCDVPARLGAVARAESQRFTSGDEGFTTLTWSHDGHSIFSTLTREPGHPRWYAYHDVVRLPAQSETPGDVEVQRLTLAGHSCSEPRVSPDGRWVAFLRTREDRYGHRVATLAALPADSGAGSTAADRSNSIVIDLTAEFDRNVLDFAWSPDSAFVYFLLQTDGAVNLWRVPAPQAMSLEEELRAAQIPTTIRGRLLADLGLSRRLRTAMQRSGVRTVGEWLDFQSDGGVLHEETTLGAEQVTRGAHEISSFDVGPDGQVVYVVHTASDPAALYLREANGSTRVLYAPNADALSELTLGAVEELAFASDEHTIQGWLLTPPGFDPLQRYPLVVEIHGGPHAQWSPGTSSLFTEFQVLAARGYAVFFCNPRGSDGYGEAFTAANWKDWGDGPMRDVLRGVDALLARGCIDAERMMVTGGSYGGYLTAWIVAHTDRFRAAVAQRGVFNLLSARNTSDIPTFFDFELGVSPWEDAPLLWQMSPVAHVQNINTPLLIEHSDLDYRVPVEQAEQLFQALAVMKKTVEFVRYPREGHELSRSGEPGHRVARLQRIADWFDRFRRS